MNEMTLSTPRLLLRPFTPDDVEAHYQAVYSDPEVMRYLPGGVVRTREQAQKGNDYFVGHWQQHGCGIFAVTHRADDKMIGHCGLNVLKEDGKVEIAYAIARPYWGKGLTTEASFAVMDYAFKVVKLPQVIAIAVPENTASRRVMEKLGMTFQGMTTNYYNLELALYTLNAPVTG